MMRQSITYTLYWIRLVDKKGRLVHQDLSVHVFGNHEQAMIHVFDVKYHSEKKFGMKLEEAPFIQQTPKEEFIMDVVGYVSMYTGITRDAILSSLQDREITDARKIISYICKDMGLMPSQIHEKTGFDRGGVYTMIKRAKELIQTDDTFRNNLTTIQENIIKELGLNGKES